MLPIDKDAERRRERQCDQHCSAMSANCHGPASEFRKKCRAPGGTGQARAATSSSAACAETYIASACNTPATRRAIKFNRKRSHSAVGVRDGESHADGGKSRAA